MALKKSVIEKFAALSKVPVATIEAAIAATDEQDVVIADDLQVMTKTESETRDRNKYNEGRSAGSEMLLKEIKTKNGIEIEGVDPDKIVAAIGAKAVAAANIAPDEQVKEAKKTADQWKAKATEAENKAAALEAKTLELSTDNKIRGLFPKDRGDILTDDEFLMSVKGKFEIKIHEGREVVVDRATGEIIKDKTKLEPVAPGEVIKGYFTERKWIQEAGAGGGQGGRGGGNSGPQGGKGKYTKLSEVHAAITGEGKSVLGEYAKTVIAAALKDNPELDMNL